jgi:sn-glycerol 3-phosphate transport system permease protein
MKKGRTSLIRYSEPFLYLLPAIVFFIAFTYYPFFKTLGSSFFRVDASNRLNEFVGLENFIRVLTNHNFAKAILNTLVYSFVSGPVYIIIAFLLALLANKKTRLSSVYEMLFAITMAMSMSVTAMIFKLMYNPSIGIINFFIGRRINWLTDGRYALWALIIITVWMNIGYNFLFLLAAVRNVSPELLESANLDGAGFFKKTTSIVIPMVSPTFFFLICNSLAWNMTMSGMTLVLGSDGPRSATETMISFMYRQAVNSFNYNDAYAAAIIAFGITFLFILISFSFENRGVYYS